MTTDIRTPAEIKYDSLKDGSAYTKPTDEDAIARAREEGARFGAEYGVNYYRRMVLLHPEIADQPLRPAQRR